jgi:hypothetical protein
MIVVVENCVDCSGSMQAMNNQSASSAGDFCERRSDGFYRHPMDCSRIVQVGASPHLFESVPVLWRGWIRVPVV